MGWLNCLCNNKENIYCILPIMLSVYSFETECMAISIHFTHVGSYLYCMIWCHLGILSILLHHYVVYFRFLSGSVSPHHMSLNMMSMNSKHPKCNQLKHNIAQSFTKIFISSSPGQSSVLHDLVASEDPVHSAPPLLGAFFVL